jgi:hypothetical protein
MMDRQLHILSNNNSTGSQQISTSLPHWRPNAHSDSATFANTEQRTAQSAIFLDSRTHGTTAPTISILPPGDSHHTILEALKDTHNESDSSPTSPWSEKSIRWIPRLGRLRHLPNQSFRAGLGNSDSTETSSLSSDKPDKHGQAV